MRFEGVGALHPTLERRWRAEIAAVMDGLLTLSWSMRAADHKPHHNEPTYVYELLYTWVGCWDAVASALQAVI